MSIDLATEIALDNTALIDGQLLKSLPLIAARIHERYPEAPLELVKRSIDDALDDLRQASVPHYLTILVERSATDALRDTWRR